MIAARILAQYILDRRERLLAALQAKDYGVLKRLVTGGLGGSTEVQNKFATYQKVLAGHPDGAGLNEIQGFITNPDWVTIHVPAILKALDAASITDVALRAYVLATADFDSRQGTIMREHST